MKGHGHRLVAALPLLALGAAACGQGAGPAQRRDQQQTAPPSVRYEAHVSAGGLPPAGAALRNPHQGDRKAAETGAGLFASMNCDGCHGGGAVGWVGPSLADGRWRYGGADEEIYQSIYYGRPKGMPAYGCALPSDAIWMLVTYLQSLPVPAGVATQSWEKP
jgi:cytochrome c oxidase cbb3-type subunit III